MLLTVLPACGQATPDTDSGGRFAGSAALEQAIDSETFKQITSVIVSVDNELVYENYWGEGGPRKSQRHSLSDENTHGACGRRSR